MKRVILVALVVCLCILTAFAGAAPPAVSVACDSASPKIGDTVEITIRSLDKETEGITGSIEMENLSFETVSSAMSSETAFILLPVLGSGEITYRCVVRGAPASFRCLAMTRTAGVNSLPAADASWTFEAVAGAVETLIPSAEATAAPMDSSLGETTPSASVALPSLLPHESSPASSATRRDLFTQASYIRTAGGARIEGTALMGIAADSASRLDKWLDISDDLRWQVFSSDGKRPVEPDTPLCTGQTVRIKDAQGKLVSRLDIVVSGDALGIGAMNISQLVRLARSIDGSEPLLGPYLLAADLSENGRVDIGDVVRAARIICDPQNRLTSQ